MSLFFHMQVQKIVICCLKGHLMQSQKNPKTTKPKHKPPQKSKTYLCQNLCTYYCYIIVIMQYVRWLTWSIWKMAHFSLQFFGLFSTFNSVLSRFSSTVCFNSQFVGFLLLVWVFLIATRGNNVFRTGKSESEAKTLAVWSRGRCHAWN